MLFVAHDPFTGMLRAEEMNSTLSANATRQVSQLDADERSSIAPETTQHRDVVTPRGVFIQEVQDSSPGYLPGELIIKFKDEAEIGEVAGHLINARQGFAEVTGSANLDKLNRRYKVKQMRRVFRRLVHTDRTLSGEISPYEAKALHREAREKFRARVDKIRKKYGRRLQNADQPEVPYLGNIYRVKVHPAVNIEEACAYYMQDPNVEYAQPDYLSTVQFFPDDPFYASSGSWGQLYPDLWGLIKIETEQAWDGMQGAGVVVAVVDTGLDYNHPDIWDNVWVSSEYISDVNDDGEIDLDDVDVNGNKIVDPDEMVDNMFGWDFVSDDNDPIDRHGHGTHVSGTIAAVGDNGVGVIGVAPRAKIMPLKGLNDFGSGSSSGLSEAITYAATNGAHVINNSWGCSSPCPSDPVVEDAVRFAYGLGVVVVFAAGNNNADVIDYSPQNMPEPVVVSATTEVDVPTFFTNFGGGLDVAAPGGGTNTPPPNYYPYRNILSLKSAVTSASMDGSGQLVVATDYLRQAGTSMAAPHVSGLAGLILGENPGFSVEQVRQAIRHGSDDVGSPGFDAHTGYGRINAFTALSETSPLEMLITHPDVKALSGVEQVDVLGTAAGANLYMWSLEYAIETDPANWILIASSTTPVINGLLDVWDLRTVPDGRHTLRLVGEQTSGDLYEDRQIVILDNVLITDPAQTTTSFFRSGDIITIKGTAAPSNFSYYQIRIWTSKNTLLSDALVALTDNGQQKVVNDVLGTWDTIAVAGDHYRVELLVTLDDNSSVSESTEVVVDPTLHPGWPQNIGLIYEGIGSLAITNHIDAEDINGDGSFDLIVGYGESVMIFHHNGAMLPGWPQVININSSDAFIQQGPAVGDLTGDGYPEIVAANNQGVVFVWQSDGTLVSGWPKSMGGSFNSLSIEDLDGDGASEIIATDWSSRVKVFDLSGNALPGWPKSLNVGTLRPPTVGDVDLDGSKEIAVVQANSPSNLYLLRSNGTIMPGWPKAINASVPSNYVASSYPALGDIDDDGDLEVVIGSIDGQVYAFHHDGTTVNGWPQSAMGATVNSPAIGDIDADGSLEVVAGTDRSNQESHLFAWNGDGALVSGWPVTLVGPWWHTFFGFGAPALADVNGDGIADAIVSTDSNTQKPCVLHAYNGDGTEASDFPKPTATIGAYSANTVAVADLDGDGLLEMTWIDRDANVYVWDLSSPVSATYPWPMFHHDAQHTGSASTSLASNYPPVLDPIGDKTGVEDELLTFLVSASDPDGDFLSLSAQMASGEPLWPIGASFEDHADGTGTFEWVPSVGQAGDHDVVFTCMDSGGLRDSESIRITVEAVTQPDCQTDADCDDGAYCNGSETCVGGTCQSGSNPCPDDGMFCNGDEFCNEDTNECMSSGNPCAAGTICNEAYDRCDEDCCGNGTCDYGESCTTCPGDCMSSQSEGTCEACFKGKCDGYCHPVKEGPDCPDCAPPSYCCGDGICEGAEDCYNCEVDCGPPPPSPYCGDDSCGSGEDQCNCPDDCGSPSTYETSCDDEVDNDCDGATDCDDSECESDLACQQSPCLAKDEPCTKNDQCCSNKCRRGKCR